MEIVVQLNKQFFKKWLGTLELIRGLIILGAVQMSLSLGELRQYKEPSSRNWLAGRACVVRITCAHKCRWSLNDGVYFFSGTSRSHFVCTASVRRANCEPSDWC